MPAPVLRIKPARGRSAAPAAKAPGAARAEACQRVSVLGATGSVGTSTLDIVGRNPERFRVVALTARDNVESLSALAQRHGAELAVVADERCYGALRVHDHTAVEGVRTICVKMRPPTTQARSAILVRRQHQWHRFEVVM